ncbi:hypothetical protein EDD85DRAFT_891876 [Armillaria nabsnona]|nr:hypothetical protein EDD85DRAFT_891876 [Armillaria nabsnona]
MNHTPVVKKAQGHSKFSVDTPEIAERHRDIANEARGHFVRGPSAEAFLEQHMPWNDATPDSYREQQPSKLRMNSLRSMAGIREKDMYERYIKALHNWPVSLSKKPKYLSTCPQLGKFRDPDTNCGNLAVDIGVYDVDDMPQGRTTDHSLMETQTELKAHDNYDAFVDLVDDESVATEGEEDDEEEDDNDEEDDREEGDGNEKEEEEKAETGDHEMPEGEATEALEGIAASSWPDYSFENKSLRGRETRGQISCYAGITMMLQYRSHLFTILICGRFARFMRWDRSGAIVSKRFDYTEETTLIFDFYKRFAQLSPGQRGKDTTVSPIADDDDDDAIVARAKFGLYDTDMWHGDARAKPKRDIKIEDQKLFRINMTLDGKARRFVVCAPKFDDGAFSPFGRSTRRSLAIDLDCVDLRDPEKPRAGLLFMKDYWREDSPRTAKESNIYHLLAQHQVPHVAEMETGGDVLNLLTITQEYVPAESEICLPILQAHRIFLKTIGRDLTTFCNVKDLVICIADAMEAHQAAFDKACILHRDISVGNIMITPGHRGFLIDWDHCIILTDRSVQKRVGRTGTWQFMSAHLLASYGSIHTLADDRESALWVLLYVALRHTRNSLSPTALHHRIKLWFQDAVVEVRGDTGGEGKRAVLNDGSVLPSFTVDGLNHLLKELVEVFAVRYQPEPSPQDDAAYAEIKVSLPHLIETTQKWKYLTKLEKMSSPAWLCRTLREHAERMKVSERAYDWCTNSCHGADESLGTSRKRTSTTSRADTKRLRGIGAEMRSLDSKPEEKKKTRNKRKKLSGKSG